MTQKTYSLDEPQFDLSNFFGRVRFYKTIMNPIKFFTAPFKLQEAEKIMQKYKQDTRTQFNEKQLQQFREARQIVSSIKHPDTGQSIQWYGRMSGFVPINIPIIFLMIMAKPTPVNIIMGQWINQTYNALMNYCNRNATSTYTVNDILKGYASAVTVSITLALSLQTIFRPRLNRIKSAPTQLLARAILTFIAAGSAGAANVLMMRQKELKSGIVIFNQEGKQLGKSVLAAKRAVYETAGSRPFMTLPSVILPPIFNILMNKMGLMPKARFGKVSFEILFCAMGLWFGLIGSISLFTQNKKVSKSLVEQQFQNSRLSDGKVIEYVEYNKGL